MSFSEAQTRVQLNDQQAPVIPDAREWQSGDVVMGLYEVRGRLGEGGMGVVHRVKHRVWGLDLAVKSPRADILARAGGQENFIFEAENWVKLGLHPHIVSCYYVRMLDGVPRVFAEYVEGGDLHEWVTNGRLYQGGEAAALERILDISIQFAWGLAYAHSLGLTHQDVKPANVLVTNSGMVKVTDFGLSRAITMVPGETQVQHSQTTAGSESRTSPFTPAYASPEQSKNEDLTHKTDLWSWGASVLEMFLGHTPNWGPLSLFILEDYLENKVRPPGAPFMPEPLQTLLRACFQERPEQRPDDFWQVTDALQLIYQEAIGRPYARQAPDAASVEADGLNNRAVSLLDLGRTEEALALFDAALSSDARHPQAFFNRALLWWRIGRLTDEGVLQALRDLETAQGESWDLKLKTIAVHLERGDEGSARRLLSEAIRLVPPHDEAAATEISQLQSDLVTGLSDRMRMEGHTEAVHSVALSSNGDILVSGGQDRTVRVWSPEQERCQRSFRVSAPIEALAISPDGRFAFCGAEDGLITVWDIQSGRCIAQMPGHTGPVWALALAQNGQVTCSGGQDGTVRLWESASGRALRVLKHDQPVRAVVASGNAGMIVSGTEDGTCHVWKTADSSIVRLLSGHTGSIRGLALTHNGRVTVSASTDGTLRLWNLERGDCITVLPGHRGAIDSLCVQPDGQWAVTGGEDRTVRLWNLTVPRCWRTLETNAGRVYGVAIAGSAFRVAAANADRVADCWDFNPDMPLANPAVVRPRRSEELLVVQTGYQDALQYAYTAMHEGDIPRSLEGLATARQIEGFERSPECLELWAWLAPYARRGRLLGTWLLSALGQHSRRVSRVTCPSSGRVALSGSEDGSIRVFDLEQLTETGHWQVHQKPIQSVAIDRHGTVGLVAVEDEIQIWNLREGQKTGVLAGHRLLVLDVAMDADGQRGVSTGKDGRARVWDVKTGQTLMELEGQGETLALRSDGRLLGWGSPGGTSRIFDLSNGEVVATMRGHEEAVRSLAFNLDGTLLATASEDKLVKIWEVHSGKLLKTLKGHTRGVCAVTMTLDGRIAISASKDKTLMVWDVASGQCVGTLVGHNEWVTSVACSADGRLCLSGCADGTIRLWYLDWELLPWDEEASVTYAMPWLQDFRHRHMPWNPGNPLQRVGPARWTEEDFQAFFVELGYTGLAGLSPEYVHAALSQ